MAFHGLIEEGTVVVIEVDELYAPLAVGEVGKERVNVDGDV